MRHDHTTAAAHDTGPQEGADPDYHQMVDFLRGLGTADVPHTGEKGFLAHLVAVASDLRGWGCDRDVCRAGLFHSIYGTELFQRFALPVDRRGEVQSLIGARAERLAFANCRMDRASFDALLESPGPYRLRDRVTGEPIELSAEDFTDLVRVHLCDWLEQVGRSGKWDYRRDEYRRMARRLGGVAVESYRRVYAQAPPAGGA